jgi:hypothetical protein
MPDIKFAAADVAAMKVGTSNVTRVMLGDFEVWPGTIPAVCYDVLTEDFDNFEDAPWVATGATIVPGRTGAAMRSFGTQRADYTIPSGKRTDTLMIGFAWRYTDTSTAMRHIFSLWSDTGTVEQNRLIYTPFSGSLQFTRGPDVIASAGSITFVRDLWYFIEVQVKLSDTNGSLTVRVNGVTVIEAVGLDTKVSGGLYDRVRFSTVTASVVGEWDDMYLSSGSACTFPSYDGGPSSFPVIASFSTLVGTDLSSTPRSIPLPAGTTPGDLLIVFCSTDGGTIINQSTGWSLLADSSSLGGAHSTKAFSRIANGSDDLFLWVTNPSTWDFCVSVCRITGHGVINLGRDVKAAGEAKGNSFTPDPPILNTGINAWYLWIAAVGVDRISNSTIYAVPAGFTMIGAPLYSAGGSSAVSQAVAQRNQQIQTLDPSPFSSSAERYWGAITVAVPGP